MNGRTIGLSLLTSLALALAAAAQETTGADEGSAARRASGKRSGTGEMYEDIEIMRRLLGGKLHGFAPRSNFAGWLTSAACTTCHGGHTLNSAYIDLANPLARESTALRNWLYHPHQAQNGSTALLSQYLGNYHANGRLLNTHVHPWINVSPARSLDTEGTYLKGQGVVFTLTLAPPARDPRPEPPKPAPKPASDWERIRKEVRQEKPQAEDTAKPQKEPTLSEIILQVLADNGKHFTQLGENELLTVAITFRAAEPGVEVGAVLGQGTVFADFDGDGHLDLFLANPNMIYGNVDGDGRPDIFLTNQNVIYKNLGNGKFTEVKAADPAAAQKTTPPKSDKGEKNPPAAGADPNRQKLYDLQLLGELHLKQGKVEEAIKVLRQALELKPEGQQAAATNRLLAQALLAAQKDEEASQAIQRAVELLKKQQPAKPTPKTESSNAPQPTPLPAKLIITVSKKLLDDVGSGKMSLAEFTKAANVEYLTFAAEKK